MNDAIIEEDNAKVSELLDDGYIPTIHDLAMSRVFNCGVYGLLIEKFPKVRNGHSLIDFMESLYYNMIHTYECEYEYAALDAFECARDVYSDVTELHNNVSEMFDDKLS